MPNVLVSADLNTPISLRKPRKSMRAVGRTVIQSLQPTVPGTYQFVNTPGTVVVYTGPKNPKIKTIAITKSQEPVPTLDSLLIFHHYR